MNTKHWSSYWQLGLLGLLTSAGINAFTCKTLAQSTPSNIQPDATLGAESSQILQNFSGLPIEVITGGATRGINLFHSLRELNVSEGRGAYFFSPGADIQNILARVTGANRSEILGTLGTFGESQPNLYLINPNGIIFGQNASLDVQSSFVGTTANGVKFGNQGEFSATNPEPVPLLTINPSALFMNRINRSEIINRSRQLAIPGSFYLIGGDITFDGGIAASLGNRLELGAVAGMGTVDLIGSGNQMQLGFSESLSKADIVLQNEALASTTGGGAIRVNARNISLSELSEISSTSNGQGDAGNIELQARSLTLTNAGNIGTQSSGSGNSGNLLVTASDFVSLSGTATFIDPQTGETLTTGSRLTTSAFGTGKSGQLTINTQRLSINDGGDITTSTELGRGGDLTINAKDSVEVVGRSRNASSTISTSTFGSGDAGSLNINTGRLSIRNGGIVTTLTSSIGKAGNLTIDAKDLVEVVGSSPSSPNRLSTISTITFGSGDAGSMRINAGSFSIRDGARVSTSTFGKGKGGNLTVNADRSVEVIGTSADGRFFTGLTAAAESGSSGNAGDLTITGQDLIVRDGAQVSTGTFGAGKGGNLTINTSNKVQLIGTSADGRFFSALGASASQGSTAVAGDVTITTQDLLVRDGATVTAGTSGVGKGGNLTVNASGSVEVIGVSANNLFNSSLNTSANQGLTGDAGDLTINTQNLLMRDGGQVGAVTSGQGKGGNLTVNATGKVELIGTSPDSSVPTVLSTSALAGSTGNAGDLTINAQDLLVKDGAQIDASTNGRGKGGNLTVNALNKVELIGTSANGRILSGLGASAQAGLTGDAGNLTIKTQDLLVRDGARAFTGTFGTGRAGNLIVNAANSVQLIGTSATDSNLVSGLLAASSQGLTGDAGNIFVDTQNLLIRDGAQVFTGTFGTGKAGNLTVNASRQVELIGRSADGRFPSGLFASAEPNSTGNAGDLTINTPDLFVRDGAGVFVNSQGKGNAGIMTINADTINLDNQGSLNANTRSPNKDPNREQATINLNTQNLTLRHGSSITTNATGENVVGGNINIYTKFLIALENSRISANSDNSRGGRVVVNARGVFVGTQPSDVDKFITATSGVGLPGTVEINSPDNSSIINAFALRPENAIDTDALLARSCVVRAHKIYQDTFYILGGGALRYTPGSVIPSTYPTNDIRNVSNGNQTSWKKGDPIIEPTGVYQLTDGRLMLSRECH
ncbi:beta strand repeat-containing protein [Fortiea contorta]|uniref:beta strand repeat-containing protein n=1 Tax=Fortiea contorta TaxID=1892405 RepID=UPI00034D07EC|nr:S-layer family protein [Fortiea contorta]